MRCRITAFTIALIFTTLCVGCSPRNTSTPPLRAARRILHPLAKSPVVVGNNAFGFMLTQGRVNDLKPGENLFVSPFSLSQALLLAANGTKGTTQTAFLKALQLGTTSLDIVNNDSKALNRFLRPTPTTKDGKPASAYEWTVANAIWSRYRPKPNYIETCNRYYSASAKPIATALAVNAWTSQKTRGRITQIIDDGDLAFTDLLLTNAVYFKGRWVTPFDIQNTFDEPFYPSADTSAKRDQPFLHCEDTSMRWYAGSHYEAVSLPYRGGMSMIVLLPESGITANAFARSLNAVEWNAMEAGFQPTWVALALPKFEIENRQGLQQTLTKLGMPEDGDFSTVSDRLSHTDFPNIYQKTFLRVDETGSEAAAVSMAGAMGGPESSNKPHPFVVNHPFLCAIVHDATGTVLFLGVINDPRQVPPKTTASPRKAGTVR